MLLHTRSIMGWAWPLGVAVLATVGCSAEDSPLYGTLAQSPVSHGFFAVDDVGIILGSLGDPEWGGLQVLPNPVTDRLLSRFIVPDPEGPAGPNPLPTQPIHVWVVPTRGFAPPYGTAADSPADPAGGAVILPPPAIPLIELVQREATTGEQLIYWDLEDTDGRRVPCGLYRVFAAVGSRVLFNDVFVYDGCLPDWIPGWVAPRASCP